MKPGIKVCRMVIGTGLGFGLLAGLDRSRADQPATTKPAAVKPAAVPKRGICGWGDKASKLGAAWYYNWWWEPDANADKRADGGIVADYVPMLKHGTDVNDGSLATIQKQKDAKTITTLLGFNEPERKDQGDTTVDKAIELWPKLVGTGLRIGSPSCSSDDAGQKWMAEFMKKASANNLKIDFVAVHYYKDISQPDAAATMVKFVDDISKKYHRPVWVTEFAGINWGFCAHKVTAETDQTFMTAVLPLLEKDRNVERYAWFSAGGEASLFADKAGDHLTNLGEVFRHIAGVPFEN